MDTEQLQALSVELTTDPLERGYASMTHQQAADDLNTVYRTRNRSEISGDEAFQATDGPEFAALTDVKKQLWLAFCGRETINPFGTANVAFVQWVFGAGSATVVNLADLRVEDVSRATELDLIAVTAEDVQKARENF